MLKKNLFLFQKNWLGRFVQVTVAKKGKTIKKARGWLENGFELFAEVLADLENNFSISLEILSLKHTVNNEVFEYIKNILEMEMDSKLLKQNIADQVKGNAT